MKTSRQLLLEFALMVNFVERSKISASVTSYPTDPKKMFKFAGPKLFISYIIVYKTIIYSRRPLFQTCKGPEILFEIVNVRNNRSFKNLTEIR